MDHPRQNNGSRTQANGRFESENFELLDPNNCALLLIDHQPQMAFGVTSIDRQSLVNNTVALAKTAQVFGVPVVLSAVESDGFSGHIWPQLLRLFPGQDPIERSTMNAWEDASFREAVEATGRKKLIIAALWTEVCLTLPALSARAEGYEVYAVTDASGGTTSEAHNHALDRMKQAGVVPVTWQQVLLELQRDWARQETYFPVLDIVKEHSGAYGMGVEYAFTMVHKQVPSHLAETA